MRVGDREITVEVRGDGGEGVVIVDGAPARARLSPLGDGAWTLDLDGSRRFLDIHGEGDTALVTLGGRELRVEIEDERQHAARAVRPAGGGGARVLRSAMPGIVRVLLVAEGDSVGDHAALLVLEAMKMQNEVRAPGPGRVTRIHVAPGTTVARGDPLVTLD